MAQKCKIRKIEKLKLEILKLEKALPFPPKRSKRPKRLTKHQILQNILPFYYSVGISERERAFRGYAETWSYAET